MGVAEYFERFVRAVWNRHYRIPEAVYWLGLWALATLTIVGGTGTADLIGGGLMLLAAVGIGRWHVDRGRCRGTLVLVRFREGAGTEGHGEEAQRILIDQLRNRLTPKEHGFIQAIPATVSGDEVRLAEQLRRRLRAAFVLHGRLASRPGGGWSVLPRILEPAQTATHYDPFTRDKTPARAALGPIVSRLPAEHGVRDEEFPFEFATDLEALTRGIAGLVAVAIGDYESGVRLLEKAIATSPESTSWLMDSLRMSLAEAHTGTGNVECGLEVLRPRVEGVDPSPHLLRGYAWLLSRRKAPRDDDRAKAEHALRRALSIPSDAQRDQTVFNLMSLLGGPASSNENKQETDELLEELLDAPSGYRRTWYVKRAVGLNAWLRALEAWEHHDPERTEAEAKQAAKWYGRALRARPRLQIQHLQLRPPFVFYDRFPRSAIIRANLVDAHRLAGHAVRARWHESWFQRLRNKQMKTAFKAFDAENYPRAYAYSDWSVVGRRDWYESMARVYSAVSLWRMNRQDEAEEVWNKALSLDRFALIFRGALAEQLTELGYDNPVPGHEPVEMDEIKKFAPELFSEQAQQPGGATPESR